MASRRPAEVIAVGARISLTRSVLPLLSLGLALTVIGACATTMTGRRQLKLLDDDQMAAMGVATFNDLKQKGEVDESVATNRYVECIVDSIVSALPQGGTAPKPKDWEVVVFEDPTPNAFALPGGKIGVHTGMLGIASTPDQLASVIGHEVAHVILRHGNERVSQTVVAQGVLQAGALVLGEMSPQYQQAIVGGLGVGAQYGVLLPFSRKHESEADLLGQRFMAKAGFDPGEAVTVWQKMQRHAEGQPPEFLSTHPSHGTRIDDLRDNLAETLPLYRAAQRAGRTPICTPPS